MKAGRKQRDRSDAEALWAFSLAVYEQPGVTAACLSLQDRYGLDVNLLLFALWAGARGATLSLPSLRRLERATAAWRQQVVLPLREVRQGLRSAPDDAAQDLRAKVLDLEIEAERLHQVRLVELLTPPDSGPDPRLAAANLRRCLALSSTPVDGDETAELATLMTAAFPDLPPLLAVWYLLP